MSNGDDIPEEFKNAVDHILNKIDISGFNMIRETQIKGTMEWLDNTEEGYVVKNVANNLGITCRKVAEMIVDMNI